MGIRSGSLELSCLRSRRLRGCTGQGGASSSSVVEMSKEGVGVREREVGEREREAGRRRRGRAGSSWVNGWWCGSAMKGKCGCFEGLLEEVLLGAGA